MSPGDLAEFTRLFEMLAELPWAKRPYWSTPAARTRAIGEYFAVLERWPLDAVRAAYVACREAEKFPTPGEWKAKLPRGHQQLTPLTPAALAERDEAERTHWERPPCPCPACVQAGVGDRPLQYLPVAAADDPAGAARHPRTGARTWRGAWTHGAALARWYRARADFWERFHRLRVRPRE